MKKEAQKKLLKAIAETADNMIEGKTCWYGREAVESAIMEMLADRLKRDHYHGLLDLDIESYLPKTNPLKGETR